MSIESLDLRPVQSPLEQHCSSLLNQDPNLRRVLSIATPGELAEKLAFGVERRIAQLIPEHPEIATTLQEIDRDLLRGDLDQVIGEGEGVYKKIHPDATLPLVGEVFYSFFSNTQQ